MIIVAKIVDAGRLPNGVERTVMKRWAALPGETLNPWIPHGRFQNALCPL